MLVGEIADEHIGPVIFLGKPQIVGLLPVFHAQHPARIEQHRQGGFRQQLVLIVGIATKTQQTQLIGPAVTYPAVEQQVVAKSAAEQQATGLHICLSVFVAAGTDQFGDQKILLLLVLHTQRHLRQLVIQEVAEQAHLEAENILIEAAVGQVQAADIQALTGKRQLHTIVPGQRGTRHIQAVILAVDAGSKRRGAPLTGLAITGQHRPGGNPATRGALKAAGAPRGQQPTVSGGKRRQRTAEQHSKGVFHRSVSRNNSGLSGWPCQVSNASALSGRLIR